jgi:hypothetical protein
VATKKEIQPYGADMSDSQYLRALVRAMATDRKNLRWTGTDWADLKRLRRMVRVLADLESKMTPSQYRRYVESFATRKHR